MVSRTIAIGDIHGCSTALDTLVDAIKPTYSDTLIQLGDAIDRGLQTQAVVETLIALSSCCRLIFIRGNHEELMLNALDDVTTLPRWLRNGGNLTLESYDCLCVTDIPHHHIDFIRSTVDYHETDRHIFLHAGYVENLEMAEQPSLALRWRVTNENTQPHVSGKTVVTGHTPQKSGNVLDLGHVFCIDTDCVRDGWLSAMDVESRTIWQSNNRGEIRIRSSSG